MLDFFFILNDENDPDGANMRKVYCMEWTNDGRVVVKDKAFGKGWGFVDQDCDLYQVVHGEYIQIYTKFKRRKN